MFEAKFNLVKREPIKATFEIKPNISEHNLLSGRDEPDCHPIVAITGLTDEISNINEAIETEASERQSEDENLQTQINEISILANGYVHEQGIASAVWMVQHNLNKYPSVTVVDSSENEIVAEVEYLDKNSVKITMIGASKGRAYLN